MTGGLESVFSANLRFLILLAVSFIALGMAVVVIFQAYRGYRRNNSRPMLYLAISLAFLTVIPFTITLVISSIGSWIEFDPIVYGLLFPLSTRGSQIIGLSLLLYSLYSQR